MSARALGLVVVAALTLLLAPSAPRPALGQTMGRTTSQEKEPTRESVAWLHVPHHRSAQELLPLAVAAMADEGSATADGDALLLVGPVSAVGRARAVLEARDVAVRMVTLTIELQSARSLRSAGYQLRPSAHTPQFQIATISSRELDAARAPGARVYDSSRDEQTAVMLRIRDGETGRIDLHEIIPLRARGLWGGGSSVLDIGSGLEATARVLGDERVRIELAWSKADVARSGRALVEDIRTSIDVEPGETVVVSALSRNVEGTGSLRAGPNRPQSSDEQVLLLHVALAPPGE